jgi:hypothetical protein
LILLLVSTVLLSAAKDLGRFQNLMSGLVGLATSLHQTVNAAVMSPAERSCSFTLDQNQNSGTQFHWDGHVAPGQSIEIKGINGNIDAQPALGGELNVVAFKNARRSDPAAVNIQVVPHAKGVTICAVYPSNYSDQSTCEPGNSRSRNQSATAGVHNNDVQVNFTVRVPAGVEFVGRTINGEINATSLNGNVDTHTVNGSINISTTGFAQAKTVNGEINARLGDANWTDAVEFKTVNGGISLDLPQTLSTTLDADTFNGDVTSDFPLTLPKLSSRRHISGTIGNGGRALILKTLNGSIRIRRAG